VYWQVVHTRAAGSNTRMLFLPHPSVEKLLPSAKQVNTPFHHRTDEEEENCGRQQNG
jgi:hypothetical protein